MVNMYCKCNDLIESTTTHVVNYKGCVIIVKMFHVESVSSAAQSTIQMKQHAS